MDEIKLTGVVISAIDYQESNKLVTIYSLQLGKITALLKGVKNKNAKLKFAGQVFCFAEFVLVKNKDFFTIIGAEQIESFYDLTYDYDKFLIAQSIIEIAGNSTVQGQISERFFVSIVKSLTEIIKPECKYPIVVLIKFILDTFSINGYEINLQKCGECGSHIVGDYYFNYNQGNIVCNTCRGMYYAALSLREYNTIKIINNTDYFSLHTIKSDNELLLSILKTLLKNYDLKISNHLKIAKSLLV